MKKRKMLEAIGRRLDSLATALATLATREEEAEAKIVGRGYSNGVRAERARWSNILGEEPDEVRKSLLEGERLLIDAQRERDAAEKERLRQVGLRLDAENALEALSKKVAGAYADRDAARADLQKEVPELKAANDHQKKVIDDLRRQLEAAHHRAWPKEVEPAEHHELLALRREIADIRRTQVVIPTDAEEALEAAFWSFDKMREKPGVAMSERDAFKGAARGLLRRFGVLSPVVEAGG